MLIKPVAALFVDRTGPYSKIDGVDYWDEKRDALLYHDPYPVVAHPPCWLWTNFAAVNYARALKEPNRRKVLPAWYPGGTDGSCFFSAYRNVLTRGGVLEHPAFTHAWERFDIVPPNLSGWSRERNVLHDIGVSPFPYYWVAEVWQSAYDHPCQKRTWLLFCGKQPPFELDWSHRSGTHQIGWFDRRLPTLNKREANLTPPRFAETLVALARHSRG